MDVDTPLVLLSEITAVSMIVSCGLIYVLSRKAKQLRQVELEFHHFKLQAAKLSTSPEKNELKSSKSKAPNLLNRHIEQLQQQLSDREQTIEKLQRQILEHEALSKLRNNHKSAKENIDQLGKKLRSSSELYKKTKQKGDNYQKKYASKGSLVIEGACDDGEQKQEFDDLKESLISLNRNYEITKKELENLRQGNAEKRRIILELEASLKDNDDIDHNEFNKILEALKIELRDSKMCTAVLESETDTLRDRVRALQIELEMTETFDASETEASKKKEEKSEKHQALDQLALTLLDTFIEISSCRKPADVAEKLRLLSEGLALSYLIYIRIGNKGYWISSEGANTDYNKQIFSKSDLKIKQWHELPQGCFYSSNLCKVLLTDCTLENCPVNLSRYGNAFLVADAALDRMALQGEVGHGQQQLQEIVEKTHRSLTQLEIRYNNILDQAREGIIVFNAEFQQFSSTVEFSDLQKDCVKDMVNDLSGRMELLFESSSAMTDDYVELKRLIGQLKD